MCVRGPRSEKEEAFERGGSGELKLCFRTATPLAVSSFLSITTAARKSKFQWEMSHGFSTTLVIGATKPFPRNSAAQLVGEVLPRKLSDLQRIVEADSARGMASESHVFLLLGDMQ